MAGQFELDLSKFKKLTEKRLNNVVRGVVLGLGRAVVENSPVGDPVFWAANLIRTDGQIKKPIGYVGGTFRANWQHGVGSMPLTKFEGTQNISLQRIQSSLSSSGDAIGKVHWIVNNLPYSIALENGHSWHQAPQGIVGRAVLNYPGIVRQAVVEAKV